MTEHYITGCASQKIGDLRFKSYQIIFILQYKMLILKKVNILNYINTDYLNCTTFDEFDAVIYFLNDGIFIGILKKNMLVSYINKWSVLKSYCNVSCFVFIYLHIFAPLL